MEKDEFIEKAKQRILERFGEQISHPTLRGRLGFDDALNLAIVKIINADSMNSNEFDFCVERLLSLIPSSWYDDEFKQALQDASWYETNIVPSYNCGVMIDVTIMNEGERTVLNTDWTEVLKAVMDLLERRSLLLVKERTQVISEGKPESNEEE